MRDTVEFAQRTSARGRGKAVLVFPAERMNVFTANALLKTLEEPAGDVKFVLASEAAHQLLPTIRSRCLGHSMVWARPGQCHGWLQGQGVPAAQACIMLRAAGGRPKMLCNSPQYATAGGICQTACDGVMCLFSKTGHRHRWSMRCKSSVTICWP